MTKSVLLVALFSLVGASARAQDGSKAQQVAEAVSPLPTDLQAGATVIRYDSAGRKTVLRNGTNDMVCSADSAFPGFSVFCYPKAGQAFRDRIEELWEKSEDEFREIISGEIKEGKLNITDRTVFYTVRGAEFGNAVSLTYMLLPNATADSTGLTTTPNPHRPWLMFAGTPVAHIMIPGK